MKFKRDFALHLEIQETDAPRTIKEIEQCIKNPTRIKRLINFADDNIALSTEKNIELFRPSHDVHQRDTVRVADPLQHLTEIGGGRGVHQTVVTFEPLAAQGLADHFLDGPPRLLGQALRDLYFG